MSSGSARTAGAFDIRSVIALLFAVYGVVLVAVGLVQPEAEKSAGVNINLWAGIGMLVFAAAFLTWARLRPITVPEGGEAEESGGETKES
ncbi:hypothetical protein [Saccharopolyspora hordei]|uniref:Uncharacterized protein n=1 Tax=Saccharopolyspora hordei TaxID=1838 RepID=A0A853AL46_9PSEU|nr:hypothetical protein [Saccharopolyspora hordei]NYI84768.1 hypothetical protein [Saccharopolyspora hordei]